MYTESDRLKSYVKQNFTIINPAAKFHHGLAKTKSAISPLYGFKSGLIFDVIKTIKIDPDFNCTIEIDNSLIKEMHPFKWDINNQILVGSNENFKLYDYQLDAVLRGLKYGRGVIHSSTGSGKSYMIHCLIKNILSYINKNFKVLLLVPSPHLVKQFFNDINEYGCLENDPLMRPSMYASFSRELNKQSNIIISSYEWIRRYPLNFEPDVLIVDEVHSLRPNNKISKIVSNFQTNIKYGFTGTLKDDEDKEAEWNIKGIIGPEIFEKLPHELQLTNQISQIHISSIKFVHEVVQPKPKNLSEIKNKYDKARLWWPAEVNYVENHAGINKLLMMFLLKLNGNTVALFDHIEHIEKCYNLIQQLNKQLNLNKQIFIVRGGVSVENRVDYCNTLEEIDNGIILAISKCFGTGINIKRVHNLVIANSYCKGLTKLIQGIGRGLRKSFDKTHLNLYDIHHSFKYSSGHFTKRLKLYERFYRKTVKDIRFKDIEVKFIK